MKDAALIAFLLAAYGGLMLTVAVMLIFLDKANKVLRQFRKLAAAIPPYPVIEEPEDPDAISKTKVEIQPMWDEDALGRS